MDISNPQYRESIIAMDGEIVRPRVRTPAQAAALTPRANMCLMKDDSVDEYYFPRGVRLEGGVYIMPKVVEIVDWNMDITDAILVAHGVGVQYKTIRSITGIVREDVDDNYKPFSGIRAAGAGELEIGIQYVGATNITVRRKDTSETNGAGWVTVGGFVRGWIMFWYTPA